MDHGIGRILAALERNGQGDETLSTEGLAARVTAIRKRRQLAVPAGSRRSLDGVCISGLPKLTPLAEPRLCGVEPPMLISTARDILQADSANAPTGCQPLVTRYGRRPDVQT